VRGGWSSASGRIWAALSGGWAAAGQLGVERFAAAARAGAERRVYASGGDGAGWGVWERWPSIRRAFGPALREIGSTSSSVCGTSGQRYGADRAGVRVAVENLERRLLGDSAALRAAAQERPGQAVAAGWGGALSTGARRLRAGLHGGDCGERRSSDCGPTGHAQSLRCAGAGAVGKGGGGAHGSVSGKSLGRCRILQQPECAGVRSAWHRRVCARPEPGAGAEHGQAGCIRLGATGCAVRN
jgi:hypothetical protein